MNVENRPLIVDPLHIKEWLEQASEGEKLLFCRALAETLSKKGPKVITTELWAIGSFITAWGPNH